MDEHASKLLAGIHNGDADVLDRLIDEYQHRLFRYLVSLTGDRTAADDLFQETWLRVLERGRQYKPEWKFEVWLFSIARHLVIDRARRRKWASLDELMNPEGSTAYEPPADGLSPFDEIEDAEQRDRLTRLLGRIPAGYREVLTLRFHEDLELAEIAAVLGASLSMVKSRLYRGLEALRKIMDREKV